MNNKQKGYLNEKLVKNYLESKWYKFLESNFTIRGWEIDLIFEKDWIIHFIEVKTTDCIDDVQDYITPKKIKTLYKTAQAWLEKNKKDCMYQFDLAFVSKWKIRFIENFLF